METLKSFQKPIYVTQPVLPDLKDFTDMIETIWESKVLTNNGTTVLRLENELCRFLNVDYLSLFSSGTVALQLACRILRLSGEVITTPFTFAATAHSLWWNNITPVFCDIEEDTYNIDAALIESFITEKTTAIMPVHVFGKPCNVNRIQYIADKHGLKIIYDAAHAFGVKIDGKPIASFGDISMFSLHASKIYHTIEGGALTFNSHYLKERADLLKNFGICSDCVMEPGTNGKLNEVQAAVGILLLKQVEDEIKSRREITGLYRKLLEAVPGVTPDQDIEGVTHNYSYFTIRVNKSEYGLSRDELYEQLREYNIFPRKYFYPLCSNFQCYSNLPSAAKSGLPVANTVADSVLVLPLYGKLSEDEVRKICDIIKDIPLHIKH